jgi:hypothetical protein
MKDLFDTPELIPDNVQEILSSFNGDFTYEELDRIKDELELIGYTFDFYLDAEPYGLRPINN